MKIRATLILSLSLLFQPAAGQPYGNEWINYSLSYYKFPIAISGVYRISQSTLQSAGFPVSSVDPANIRMYARGVEVALHIQGEGDGSFDVSDFIEFYAEGNDGRFDQELYGSSSLHPNPFYSLYTDSIYYYLTIDPTGSPRRFTPETDVNYGAYAAANFVWRESTTFFNTTYYDGQTHTGGGTDPSYESTEGWFDTPFSLGQTRTRTVETVRAFTSGPASRIHWKVVGSSNFAQLAGDHHLNVQFASQTFDTIYEGYQVIDKQFSVATAALGTSTTNFSFRSINDLGSGADRSAISFIQVKYPMQLHFNNKASLRFSVPDQAGQSKSYLPFTGLTASSPVWIYDLTNDKRITVTTTGLNYEVLIPNAGNEKSCLVFSEGNVLSVNNLHPINGNGSFTDFGSQAKQEGFVIITHERLKNSAIQYGAYREGTGYQSLVVDVNELYDQFSFGIRTHPNAIRHFADFIADSWPEKPSALFLIGKSIKAQQARKDGNIFRNNLVPTYGNPGSDILLTAGLNGTFLEPLIPTGRLSAQSADEVQWYLQKVIDYEGADPELWMKNILHFAGGSNEFESNRFTSYLSLFEGILTDTAFGGKVFTFKKNTTAPIQTALSDSIRGLINNGASILTFFGHASSTGGFDQNIDEPANLNNKGKYPLLVGNSCFTGDIHEAQGQSTSEKFVLIEDKGVIAFLASVDLGFEDRLRDYSRHFFVSLGQENYGGTLGQHVNHAIQKVQIGGNTFPVRSITTLMTLHGDPALVINSHALTDYVVGPPDIGTNPTPVTTKQDTFELKLHVVNRGKAIPDSVRIEVNRSFPNLTKESYIVSAAPVLYETDLTIKLPVERVKGIGINQFEVIIDPSNLVPEISETNNSVTLDVFIKSGDIIPVIPQEFALIPNQHPILKASTGYAFETEQEYEFQLDTNGDFTDPIETHLASSGGGVINWQPDALTTMPDSAVYFWRARNTDGNTNSVWRTSSFQYIPGTSGWSQDHFHQYRNDNLQFIEMDEVNRRFDFSPSVRKLSCQTSSTLNFSDLGDILYKLDADLQEYGGCGLGPALHVAVLDSLSFEPWGTPFGGSNPANYFGQINFDGNCGKPRVQKFFIFQANNATQLAGLKDMITTKVPDGNFILAWTWVRNDFSKWDAIDPTLRQTFVNLGADSMATIANDSVPYIFFVKKGTPATAMEVVGLKYDEFIFFNTDLMNNSTYGSLTSTVIGPAARWDSVRWKHYAYDDPVPDSMTLNITGFDKTNVPQSVAADLFTTQQKFDLTGQVDAAELPYLGLDYFVQDNVLQTVRQPDYWMVFYKGVPEFALQAKKHFRFHADTLAEGDSVEFEMAVQNISMYDSDSLLVRFYITDRNRNIIPLPDQRIRPLLADSSVIISTGFPTNGLTGQNTLTIDVNPDFDQPEQQRFNNLGQLPFVVLSDQENPVLDVTFDGLHIFDGDLVSAKPEIEIRVIDDNPYLLLNDTADVSVFITPVGGLERQVYFEENDVRYEMNFEAAGTNGNQAVVRFSPILNHDGVYALRVKANDRTKNESGDQDYMIRFQVINESTITHLRTYPNPLTTSTRFAFEMTGSELPEIFNIYIYSMKGELVRTITRSEFGPLRVGRNNSAVSWDGRNQHGDKLSNGLYIYEVDVRLNGQVMQHRPGSYDSRYGSNVGKLMILR